MKNYCTGIMTCMDPCLMGKDHKPCRAIVEYRRTLREFSEVRRCVFSIHDANGYPHGCLSSAPGRKVLLPLQGHPLTKKERTKYFAQLL